QDVVLNAVREISVLLIVTKVFEWEDRNAFLRDRRCRRHRQWRIEAFGSFDPLGGEVEDPGKNQCDWKPYYQQDDDEPHRPVWDFEKRKDLSGNLREQPAYHRVGDRNPIDL